MKKVILAGIVCVLTVVIELWFSSSVSAQNKGEANTRTQEEAAVLEAQKPEVARQDALVQQRKIAEQSARQILQSKEWGIYLSPESGSGKTEMDTLTFTGEGQVLAKNLYAKGYSQSNFRLTPQDDGSAVWETMQVDKNKNLVFLRGILQGNEMTGSFFMKPVKGEPVSYLYTTIAPPAPVPQEPTKKRSKRSN